MKRRLNLTITMLVLALALFVTNAQAQTETNATNNQSNASNAATPAVVTRLNNLTGNVILAAGANTKITRTGNTITIAESISGLKTVAHDATLKGNGTPASPLSVVSQVPASQPFRVQKEFKNQFPNNVGCFLIGTVPAGKRLFVEYTSVAADLPQGQQLTGVELALDAVLFQLLPVHTSDDTTVDGARSNFRVGQQTPLFVDHNIQICVNRNDFAGVANFKAAVSGHLVGLQ